MAFVHQTVGDRCPINILFLFHARMKGKGILTNVMARRVPMIPSNIVHPISGIRPFLIQRKGPISIRRTFRFFRRVKAFLWRLNVTMNSDKGFVQHMILIQGRLLGAIRVSIKGLPSGRSKFLRFLNVFSGIVR